MRNTSLIQEQCFRIREEGDLGYNVFLASYLPAQGQGLVFECSEERATKESEGQAHQILTKKWELQGPGAKTDRVACNTEVVRACLPFIMEMTADNTLSEDGCLETIIYTRLRGKKNWEAGPKGRSRNCESATSSMLFWAIVVLLETCPYL